jgi:hypothetical protein
VSLLRVSLRRHGSFNAFAFNEQPDLTLIRRTDLQVLLMSRSSLMPMAIILGNSGALPRRHAQWQVWRACRVVLRQNPVPNAAIGTSHLPR